MGKEKFQVCMASKLPRVVPTRTRSGLVHGLNMIAFNVVMKAWYSSEYI